MSKIEWVVGDKYLTRDGREVYLHEIFSDHTYPYNFVDTINHIFIVSTLETGRALRAGESGDDIIKKIEEPKMKPHKWSKEIHAWADGANIQFREFPEHPWSDVSTPSPSWDLSEGYEYRIKPDPVKVKYRVALVGSILENIEPMITYPHVYEMTELCFSFIRWIPDANGNIDYEVDV